MSTQQKAIASEESSKEVSIFQKAIDKYITQINSLIDTMPVVLNILASNAKMRVEKIDNFFKKFGIDELQDDKTIKLPIEVYGDYDQLTSNADKAIAAIKLYPCNMVVSFVSMYDAFLGNIIKAIYKICPEKLKECRREISINDILLFESIDEAKEQIIEKEAETVIRESHSKQLEWFENKLGCKFKSFDSYSHFIEITERRNLFVHTNGVVSRQYINECKNNKVKNLSDIKVGDTLYALPEYVLHCYHILFEVGVKLGVIIWRKLRKGDEDADYYLNAICYDLIKQKRYALAKTMLHFATEEIKNPAKEEVRRMFVINRALVYYLSGDKNTCNAIIDKEDWSASAIKFQLAVDVLKDNYELATSKMDAAKSDIGNIAYYEWPLFNVSSI